MRFLISIIMLIASLFVCVANAYGAQVVIPIRFVQTTDPNGPNSLHPDSHIEDNLIRVNKIWKSVGIKYEISSIERYQMPNIRRYVRDQDDDGCQHNQTQCFMWSEVREELQQIFPHMPDNAYPDNDRKSSAYWMHATSALFGDPNEIMVWLIDEGGKSGNAAPYTGRMVYLRSNGLRAGGVANATFAHELGHFFNARHLDETSVPPGYSHCDRWNDVYLPSNPNTFFLERNNPNCDPSGVRYITPDMDSITADSPFGPVRITLNGRQFVVSGSSVDDEIKGLFQPTGLTHSPPSEWGFARNVMGGIGPADMDGTMPRFFSASQKAMITDFLNRDVKFTQFNADLWMTEAGGVPNGMVAYGLTSLRTKLGSELKTKISGAPSVISWAKGHLGVFVRTENGQVWFKQYTESSGWTRWIDLEGHVNSQISAVSWGKNRIDAFALGSNSQLLHIRYSKDKGWSNWRDLGGSFQSVPSAVSWGSDRLDIFARGVSNNLMHIRYSGDKGWSNWRNLGGEITLAPNAVSWGTNRLDVFAIGSSSQLIHKRYSADKGWSEWRDLGGALKSAATVVSWGSNRLDVFAVGFSYQLLHKRYSADKGWSEWRDLGGQLTSPPAVASWGSNRLDVFVRDADNKLAHKRYSIDHGWSSWRDLGGRLKSAPMAVAWAPERLDVFVKGNQEKAAHIRYSRLHQWSNWRDISRLD